MSDEPISLTLVRPKTALEEISAALDDLLLRYRARQLEVRVGDSAREAIKVQTLDHLLPHLIKGVRVSQTVEFRGWGVFANGREVE